MAKKVTEITPLEKPKTQVAPKEKKIEAALVYRNLDDEDKDRIKKKVYEIAEKNKIRVDIYQKKTVWAKDEKNEK
jgi:hypothetical protein